MMSTKGWKPPFGSPEFRTYLEIAINSSKSRREAARKLGYKDPKTITYHMGRMGIDRPTEWDRRPWVSPARWKWLPEVLIPGTTERNWVAGLTQGETCIQSKYVNRTDTTYLVLDTSMADSQPIFRLADYVGLRRSTKPVKNHHWKPAWRVEISGLRAFRVLKEITPYLVGEKKREAERAIEFFDPFGNRRGCHRNSDVWPTIDFPSRTKRRGSNMNHSQDRARRDKGESKDKGDR